MNRLISSFPGANILLTVISMTLSIGISYAQERGIYHIQTGEDLSKYQDKLYSDNRTLFGDHQVFEMSIISDFKSFRKNKKDPEYQDAIYKLKLNDTVEVVNNFRIKPRGNFRRSLCMSPPIKMNFKKTEFFSDATDNLKSLKLVNTCEGGKSYQALIFKEYLVYRMFNILTDHSFKVRLLKIKFVDTGRKNKTYTSYGFMIEDIDEVANRLNAIEVRSKIPNQDMTNLDHLNMVTTFQFMVGNTDWSIPGDHNVKFIKSKDVALPSPFVIPYDFDFSGVVNAPYAEPNPVLPIKDIRTRLFRGLCRNADAMEPTFEKFRKKRNEVNSLIKEFPYLSESDKNDMIGFIDGFYSIINDKKKANKSFSVNCK